MIIGASVVIEANHGRQTVKTTAQPQSLKTEVCSAACRVLGTLPPQRHMSELAGMLQDDSQQVVCEAPIDAACADTVAGKLTDSSPDVRLCALACVRGTPTCFGSQHWQDLLACLADPNAH
eukprot:3262912-Amphidinium_carterae.1